MTGVWVLAHECGHQSFSDSEFANNVVGTICHSLLLVPYHSWRISHSKHHNNTVRWLPVCHWSNGQTWCLVLPRHPLSEIVLIVEGLLNRALSKMTKCLCLPLGVSACLPARFAA
jgi:hypothetical protein